MAFKRIVSPAVAALLAASSALAQVRTGAAVEAGISGASGASVLTGPGVLQTPALSPALGAATLSATLSAPAAAPVLAATPLAPVALSPVVAAPSRGGVAERAAAIKPALEALAPANLGKLSGEGAKTIAGTILGESGASGASADAVVAGLSAASTPDLGPASGGPAAPKARAPRSPETGPRKDGLLRRLEIALHYANRWQQEYYWYSVTHIAGMWPSYRERWNAARAEGVVNVTRPRAFFSHMRVAGTSGKFYVLGISPLEDEAVITTLRHAYLMWFDGRSRGPAELAAFDRFTDRALLYNAERRAPTNMRKHIRDALIKASTMKPAQIAPFFDSLLVEETARETADFQNKGSQKRILDEFKTAVLATLAEEPKGDRSEVLGALIMGSFASGSAGPKSDFDLEVFTRGGREKRVPDFIDRLTKRWIASGHHARNPVGVHEHPYKPYRGVVDMVHSADYIIVSHDPKLIEALQRKPGEAPKFHMLRRHTFGGFAGRAIQAGVIFGATFWGDLKHSLGIKTAGH